MHPLFVHASSLPLSWQAGTPGGGELLTQNFLTVEGGGGGGAVPAMLSLQVGGSFHAAVKPLYPSVFTIVAMISHEANAIITPIIVLVMAVLPVWSI
ncbi:MAG: hypothetical protein A3H64_00225 [Candidatus Ryanbacteria bacterium RIFCSPLOWO2_02_FULL_45_11c]|uniref:Uncharacterized protein n=1 Tax=Candidatus Ryanbacteria bacterium RIFCSPLOWO2_02_FULL_45_11c TaxID=1802128 RepID=A0A1G2GYL3_9BACT|nr:MAG: hypothetical protein A3H64_00225 [Candidatus Ryanbacteria bacterium RIFCSPLOWO2_02_FULL_45_11c]